MPQQPKAHAFAGWPCSQPPRQPIRPKVRGAVAVAGGSTCGGGFRSEATSSIATASAVTDWSDTASATTNAADAAGAAATGADVVGAAATGAAATAARTVSILSLIHI